MLVSWPPVVGAKVCPMYRSKLSPSDDSEAAKLAAGAAEQNKLLAKLFSRKKEKYKFHIKLIKNKTKYLV